MQTANEQAELAIRNASGRKDNDGIEAVIKTKPLKDGIHELMRLKTKADQKRDDLAAAVKRIAEQSGLLSSVVRKLVNARTGDKFQEEKRKVEQLGIVFEEVGEEVKLKN